MATLTILLSVLNVSGCSLNRATGNSGVNDAMCPRMSELGRLGLSSTGRIVGEVYSAARKPIKGSLIEVVATDGSSLRATLANSEGVFRIDSIPLGNSRVRIRSIGYDTQEHHVTVVDVAPTVVCAVMQETRIPLHD